MNKKYLNLDIIKDSIKYIDDDVADIVSESIQLVNKYNIDYINQTFTKGYTYLEKQFNNINKKLIKNAEKLSKINETFSFGVPIYRKMKPLVKYFAQSEFIDPIDLVTTFINYLSDAKFAHKYAIDTCNGFIDMFNSGDIITQKKVINQITNNKPLSEIIRIIIKNDAAQIPLEYLNNPLEHMDKIKSITGNISFSEISALNVIKHTKLPEIIEIYNKEINNDINSNNQDLIKIDAELDYCIYTIENYISKNTFTLEGMVYKGYLKEEAGLAIKKTENMLNQPVNSIYFNTFLILFGVYVIYLLYDLYKAYKNTNTRVNQRVNQRQEVIRRRRFGSCKKNKRSAKARKSTKRREKSRRS